MIGTKALAQGQTILARAHENNGCGPKRLGHPNREQPDRPRPDHHDLFAREKPPELDEAVHRWRGTPRERGLFVRHSIGYAHERIYMIDRVLCEPTVGREAIGAVALVIFSVVVTVIGAGRVHAGTAALALAATGVDLHRNALAQLVFVHPRTERGNRAHIFMTRGEPLVERQCAVDNRGWAIGDYLQIGSTNGHRINADEHFGSIGNRDLLLPETQLARVSKCPCEHLLCKRSRSL